MRYWDTSALALLLARQPGWELVRDWLASDPTIVTSWLTPVECWSALSRLTRMGAISDQGAADAGARLREVLVDASELSLSDEVRVAAIKLLGVHPLRVADALHLASALLSCGWESAGHEFVTFDRRLAAAARREGFGVLTAPE